MKKQLETNSGPQSSRSSDLVRRLGSMVVSGRKLEGRELEEYLDAMPDEDFRSLVEDVLFVSVANAADEAPPKGTLARAVWDARGGPAEPKTRMFA